MERSVGVLANPTMVIIDGNSLINRAYYALPPLNTKDGVPTNAVYGFLTMLFKILDEHCPDYISVAFDRKEATFRHQEYDGYKAQRKGMPDELACQMPLLKDLLDVLGINRIEIEGYEADDIIGTLSRYGEEQGLSVLVVTGDRDALQLVSRDLAVVYTKRGVSDFKLYGPDEITEEYGLEPERLTDLKGLMGDKSDNIPGVPGVGRKTALKLLHSYRSLEGVLEGIQQMPPGKLRDSLTNNMQQALLSKRLATICRDVPIDIDLESCKRGFPDQQSVLSKLSDLEFNSLIERAKRVFWGQQQDAADNSRHSTEYDTGMDYCCVYDIDGIKKAVSKIVESGRLAFEIVVSTDEHIEFDIYGISVAWNPQHGVYIPVGHSGFDIQAGSVFELLRPVMENPEVEKYGYHLKQDIIALKLHGIELRGYAFDAEIFAYLLDPASSSYELEKIALKYLGSTIPAMEMLTGKGKNYTAIKDIEPDRVCRNMACRAQTIFGLKDVMIKQIDDLGLSRLAYQVELPLVEVLADMEISGIKIDKGALEDYSAKLQRRIDSLTDRIFRTAGRQFNINSPKQLGEVLFVDLGLPPIKKTKTGYSTDAEVLEQLMDRHPIIGDILEYRQLVKLKTTYTDGLLKAVNPNTGRIHSSFKQTVTATGRISSTEPNLQNIPVRLELGKELRRVFVPENKDYIFVDADYSQIELRVLAHISGDPNLVKAFTEDQDIHIQTAAQVFGVSPEDVTPAMRSSAKAVNFGIIYGISDYGLSQNLRISRKSAAEYIEKYFARFNVVKEYMGRIIKQGLETGMVTTILGRIRYLPELRSNNRNLRGFGERMAMNTPIQGSAADIMKLAMIKVHSALKDKGLRSRLVLQVHDELIVEAHRKELDMVKAILTECMETAVELKVPLKVDLAVGNSWYEAK
jgi:DNA polymerase-1